MRFLNKIDKTDMIWNKIPTLPTPLYLLLVVESTGSAPGRVGFKMLVDENGPIDGSIGGGVMEYNLVEMAKERIRAKEMDIFIKKQVHRQGLEDSSGMICSGEQTIAFVPIVEKDQALWKKIADQAATQKTFLIRYSDEGVELLPHDKNNTPSPFCPNEKGWSYTEPLNDQKRIYIIGAGHVGAATSQLFNLLGFKVIVLDNRPDINTLENNRYANEVHIVDYRQILQYIPESPQAHIAIMTTKFTEDQIILQQLSTREYPYIGVLGSKTKLTKMFANLKKKGVPTTFIEALHAPIGLKISSQTPMEIAVSIAGEVIKFHQILDKKN